jgi:hypothetical protein
LVSAVSDGRVGPSLVNLYSWHIDFNNLLVFCVKIGFHRIGYPSGNAADFCCERYPVHIPDTLPSLRGTLYSHEWRDSIIFPWRFCISFFVALFLLAFSNYVSNFSFSILNFVSFYCV